MKNVMKHIHYVIEGVLALAVITLFVLHLSSEKASHQSMKEFVGSDGEIGATLPIAYINVDTLLEKYNYAQDLFNMHIRSQENAQLSLSEKMHDLEQDASAFQRKVENNVFISRERAQQEQQRIMRKQQDVEDYRTRVSGDLMQEQERLNKALRDTIVAQLHLYNKDKHYHLIMSNTNGDNILLSEDAYDITTEIIVLLNKNYAPAPAK
jgi:outer membrane protein